MAAQIPIVNAGLLYVNGLTPGTTADSAVVGLAPGSARDVTNTNDIVLPLYTNVSGLVNGANGLDTGVLANNTVYAVFVIGDSTKYNPTAGLLSLNNAAPSLPAGYDMFRRVGWAQTEAAAPTFRKWYHLGNGQDCCYYFDKPIQILAAGTSTSYVPVNALLPGINTQIILKVSLIATGPTSAVHLYPLGSPNAAANADGMVVLSSCGTGTQISVVEMPVIYAVAQGYSGVQYKIVSATSVKIEVIGFYDDLD